MNTRLLIIVIILIMLSSCTASYFITIRQNGSAIVNIDRDYPKTDINRYYKSDVISSIDTNICLGGRVAFEISSIDSLGTYLPFHPPGFFHFNMVGNTLIVTDGHTNPFKPGDLSSCHDIMFIKFDKDILSVESINRRARQKDTRTVLIKMPYRHLIKGKKRLDVTIKIK